MSSLEEIMAKINGIGAVMIMFADLNGRLKALSVSPGNIRAVMESGIGFDGSSVAGIAKVGESDRLLFPVPESLRILEFANKKLGFFVGCLYDEKGKRSKCDPRAILENVLAQAESEYRCQFQVGPEYEFFLLKAGQFDRDVHSDSAGYMDVSPHDKGEDVRRAITNALDQCGIKSEKSHHEVTPSQHEINLAPLDPLEAGDRTLFFVNVTQRVAQTFGYHASFMPKPFDGYNRNAFHIHISMKDQEGNNLFYDAAAKFGLSNTGRCFIGGILKYARETSIIMASTFNSYKAYVIEREAPVIRGWGIKNRSSMVRLPYVNTPENIRLELRNPDPLGNVYLQLASLIAMGIQGMRENLDCGKPDKGSAYAKAQKYRIWDKRFLPSCMFEALVEAERSTFLKNLLGQQLFDNYMALKTAEWEEHRTHVTPREHERYLWI